MFSSLTTLQGKNVQNVWRFKCQETPALWSLRKQVFLKNSSFDCLTCRTVLSFSYTNDISWSSLNKGTSSEWVPLKVCETVGYPLALIPPLCLTYVLICIYALSKNQETVQNINKNTNLSFTNLQVVPSPCPLSIFSVHLCSASDDLFLYWAPPKHSLPTDLVISDEMGW